MIITVTSILVISAVMWLIGRVYKLKLCPICAGVSLTWIGMFIAGYRGYAINPVILSMLIGASIVGIAYQLEKKLPAVRSGVLWKILFIPSGFVAGNSLVQSDWRIFVGAIIWISILICIFFFLPKPSVADSKITEELEKKMEKCC